MINKSVSLDTGVSATYWVIGSVDVASSKPTGKIYAVMHGYLSKDAYLANKAPLKTIPFEVSVQDFLNDAAGPATVSFMYGKALALPFFDGATLDS